MGNANYPFEIGSFACKIVSDGTVAYGQPAQRFFTNAPQERLEQVLREHGIDPGQWDTYVSPYPSLLIDTGQHQVLVDTGAGPMAPSTGKLIGNLQAAGTAPDEIDVVIPTHGHPDHWYAVFDLAPEQTVTSRHRLMERAAAEGALVFAYHFPVPGLGHITHKGDGWRWQPIETTG